jgi:ATP-binding cassette, subfamily C, bacterial EexD
VRQQDAPRRPQESPQRRNREVAPRSQTITRRRPQDDDGLHERLPVDIFADAIDSVRRAILAAGIFSLFTNVLTLAGPLYMLQVYDRVLPSGSGYTLAAISVMLVVLYTALGYLEMLRGQILNRIAGRLDTALGPATMEALPRHRLATGKAVADEPLRDLQTLRQFISGSGPAAFFDLPWAPLFLIIIFLIHWSLGVVTLLGMGIMVAIAIANEIFTKSLLLEGKKATEKATKLALESGRNMEAAVAMGMMDPIVMRWQAAQQRADAAMRKAGDRMAAFSSASKIFRMFMQSVLLGAGALLAIEQIISSGMMIAVSIIGGKALGPIGTVVSQWRGLNNARDAFGRLKSFHKRYPAQPKRLALPPPTGRIEVRNVQATPPGADLPVLHNVSFTLQAGDALAVIGASAAGKSTLARVMIGLWPPDRGSVRLDGADLRMWNRDQLGPKVGYLPQTIELFEGTVAQNISRFYPDATPEAIFRAAEMVGVHEMIVDLPDGYSFNVGENGLRLSAGQRQRIGLARAVYGNPVLVVLDEPNANLDVLGEAALRRAIKALKDIRTTVVLITHRPSGLEVVDRILVLEKGEVRAFGEKEQVLKALKGAKQAIAAKAAAQTEAIPAAAPGLADASAAKRVPAMPQKGAKGP